MTIYCVCRLLCNVYVYLYLYVCNMYKLCICNMYFNTHPRISVTSLYDEDIIIVVNAWMYI